MRATRRHRPVPLAVALVLVVSCSDSGHLLGQANDAGNPSNPGAGGAGGSMGGAGAGVAGLAGASGAGGMAGGSAAGTAGAAAGAGGVAATCPATPCATGLICERYGGPLCVDGDWAAWPMPNSPADAADGAPLPASYTDNGDGTVTDNLTQLMWQQTAPSTMFDPNQAVAYCEDLTLAGHDDWRLPKRIELISIVDYGRARPAIDPIFTGTPPDNAFWTSSSTSDTLSAVWVVSFVFGNTGVSGFPNTYLARCVR